MSCRHRAASATQASSSSTRVRGARRHAAAGVAGHPAGSARDLRRRQVSWLVDRSRARPSQGADRQGPSGIVAPSFPLTVAGAAVASAPSEPHIPSCAPTVPRKRRGDRRRLTRSRARGNGVSTSPIELDQTRRSAPLTCRRDPSYAPSPGRRASRTSDSARSARWPGWRGRAACGAGLASGSQGERSGRASSGRRRQL